MKTLSADDVLPEIDEWQDAGEVLDPRIGEIMEIAVGEYTDELFSFRQTPDEQTIQEIDKILVNFNSRQPTAEESLIPIKGAVVEIDYDFEVGKIRDFSGAIYGFEKCRMRHSVWDTLGVGDPVEFCVKGEGDVRSACKIKLLT